MGYPYILKDNLEDPQHYHYSKFSGEDFIKAYFKTRKRNYCGREIKNDKITKKAGLIYQKIHDDSIFELIIKTFEVNKRLYDDYSFATSKISSRVILSPNKSSSYRNPYNYIAFVQAIMNKFRKTKEIYYLNVLFKINDILISSRSYFNGIMKNDGESIDYYLQEALEYEKKGLCNILKTEYHSKISKKLQEYLEYSFRLIDIKNTPLEIKESNTVTIMQEVAMLYAITSRSKIYLQTMLSQGILPSLIIFLSEEVEEIIAVRELLKNYNIHSFVIYTRHVNDDNCIEQIRKITQKYIIYSGYSGEILCRDYFQIKKKIIHVHAGELPYFRGSTTCYYSLLKENKICASVIFLNECIDEGDIIHIEHFDCQKIVLMNNADIDGVVEPYIRAVALVKALKNYIECGVFMEYSQANHENKIYYVIHPVLKHLAILKCFGENKL